MAVRERTGKKQELSLAAFLGRTPPWFLPQMSCEEMPRAERRCGGGEREGWGGGERG